MPIYGPMAIRWYGLAYLIGFVSAFFLLKHLSKTKKFVVSTDQVSNLIVLIAMAGVFLGGRLGYVLFYGLDSWRADPLFPIKIWEGGMASHGGILGVLIVLFFYARKHRYSLLNLMDNFACVAPIGLFAGRIANFINGELWGRITTVPWAVIFPTEKGYHYPKEISRDVVISLYEQGLIQPRHPSQLYEAFGEGLFLFLLMWILRKQTWSDVNGRLSGVFLFAYGIVRITVEFFREPDSTIYFGWMTKGQLLSVVMVLSGLVLLIWKRHRRISE